MDYLNASINATGMADILLDDDDKKVDINDLEYSITHDDAEIDTKSDKELNDLTKYEKFADQIENDFGIVMKDKSDKSTRPPTPFVKKTSPIEEDTESNNNDNQEEIDESDDQSNPHDNSNKWAMNMRDPQINRMTIEEKRQNKINKVLNNLDNNNDDAEYIDEEDEEDEIAKYLEQIDELRSVLEDSRIDTSKIPDVDANSSLRAIKTTFKRLQKKNDNNRCCVFFNELLMMLGYYVESHFDGQTEYFGSKPDLTGWPDTLKSKLYRMRFDTSSIVSDSIGQLNIGPVARIVAELGPSMYLHTRERKQTKDNLISDNKFRDMMRNIDK